MGVFNIKGMGLMMDKFWMNPFTVNKRFSNVFQMSARSAANPHVLLLHHPTFWL